MNIAFLGMGAMGSRMSERLAKAGHQLTVWNRSGCDATRDTARGEIQVAATPAEAVHDAKLVFSMVRDDEASASVWLGEHGALLGMNKDALAIECSTLSLPFILELSSVFKKSGKQLIDAPLAGSRKQAEEGKLIFLAGGEAPDIEMAKPALLEMGSACFHAGDNGSGVLTKLLVNTLFGTQLAVLAELIGLTRKTGFDVSKVLEIVCATPVASPAVSIAYQSMINNSFSPAFPIDLVEKDFGLTNKTASEYGAELPVINAVQNSYAKAIELGFGEENITGIVQLFL